MKLTNISLAILVAVGVAACGGSGDNNSPVDPPKPNPNNNNNSNNNNKPTPPDAGTHVVDPTGTQVVDDKDLTKQNTVGTLQYIRRDGSQYDRTLNPSKPASASPLLGTTLNDQNPSLTNIVLARQEIVRADGTPVKAQFTGSDNPMPLRANGEVIKDSVAGLNSLQEENFANVDVLAGMYAKNVETKDGEHADKANNVNDKNRINRVINNTAFVASTTARTEAGTTDYVISYGDVNESGQRIRSTGFGTADIKDPTKNIGPQAVNKAGLVEGGSDIVADKLTAIIDPVKWKKGTDSNVITGKDADNRDLYTYRGGRSKDASGREFGTTVVSAEAANATSGTLSGSRYGKDLVWWSAPETAFENWVSRGNSNAQDHDLLNTTKSTNGAASASETIKSADGYAATNGLVRVGGGLSTLGQELNWNKDEKKWENHHNTTTRIFGRYHLAYANTTDKNKGIHPVALNSFSGAKTFVAEVENTAASTPGTKATQYSIGAVPMTLKYVQYGRVTTQLDVDEGVKGYADNFIRNPYAKKNTDDSVDDYFYRGTNATTIEQMAALPSDQKATYQGHALMYGIDNDFHNAGKRNLPNAFAGKTDGLGLGNFVEATADFGTKRLQGNVYNEWLLDQTKSATTRDNLVAFQGNIVGNTVVGTADRAYLAGDDKATFKASFFGEKAEELGGSFNSVKDADKYGSAYGENDWGGVFGATRGGTSNTFQGDDSNNVYGSQQNGQQP